MLLAALQLRIHHAHEPVGARPVAGRQEPARHLRVVRRRHFRSENFLHGLALPNQLLDLRLDGEDHVAIRDDVGPVDEGAVAGDEPGVGAGNLHRKLEQLQCALRRTAVVGVDERIPEVAIEIADRLIALGDVSLVQQDFNMDGLLSGDIDAAEAMTYNEYAQVLESVNPDTGELYTPDELNVVSYEEVGVGMLQDAIWADGEHMASDESYIDLAGRFVAASLQGWAYCRDNVQECVDIVVAKGSKLGASHQLWQMNEINKLIWPAANGVGMIDPAAWDRTVQIAMDTPNLEGTTVLTAPPTDGAYTNDIVSLALTGTSTTWASRRPAKDSRRSTSRSRRAVRSRIRTTLVGMESGSLTRPALSVSPVTGARWSLLVAVEARCRGRTGPSSTWSAPRLAGVRLVHPILTFVAQEVDVRTCAFAPKDLVEARHRRGVNGLLFGSLEKRRDVRHKTGARGARTRWRRRGRAPWRPPAPGAAPPTSWPSRRRAVRGCRAQRTLARHRRRTSSERPCAGGSPPLRACTSRGTAWAAGIGERGASARNRAIARSPSFSAVGVTNIATMMVWPTNSGVGTASAATPSRSRRGERFRRVVGLRHEAGGHVGRGREGSIPSITVPTGGKRKRSLVATPKFPPSRRTPRRTGPSSASARTSRPSAVTMSAASRTSIVGRTFAPEPNAAAQRDPADADGAGTAEPGREPVGTCGHGVLGCGEARPDPSAAVLDIDVERAETGEISWTPPSVVPCAALLWPPLRTASRVLHPARTRSCGRRRPRCLRERRTRVEDHVRHRTSHGPRRTRHRSAR